MLPLRIIACLTHRRKMNRVHSFPSSGSEVVFALKVSFQCVHEDFEYTVL